MTPSPETVKFEKATIGTVVFTPETLQRTYQTEVVGRLVISETQDDRIPLTQRIEIAKVFIQTAYITELDKELGIYQLSDRSVAILLVLYGEDVVQSLFDTRVFEFKTKGLK